MKKLVDLEKFADGALSEKFNISYNEVLENILDPNTKTKAVRKLTLELNFKLTEDRELSIVEISTKTRLAPNTPTSTKILIDSDGQGGIIASEYDKQFAGQTYMQVSEDTGEVITEAIEKNINIDGIKLVK